MTFEEALKDPKYSVGYRFLFNYYQVCNELNKLDILTSTNSAIDKPRSGKNREIKSYVLINC